MSEGHRKFAQEQFNRYVERWVGLLSHEETAVAVADSTVRKNVWLNMRWPAEYDSTITASRNWRVNMETGKLMWVA